MRLATFHHDALQGWSTTLPRELDSPHTWVLVFGPRDALRPDSPARAALDELRSAFPQAILQGCSSAGEIVGTSVLDDTIAVAVVCFESTRLVAADTPLAHIGDSAVAGTFLAAALPAQGLRAVFVLSDGLAVNGTALVGALAAGLPPAVPITGGLAGDGTSFSRTWVLADGRPLSGHVSVLGLYGEQLSLGHGCDGGWSDFGPERRITRAEGNVLHELDGEPALDLYKTYLGDMAAGLPGTALLFPLAVRQAAGGERLVRTVLSVDERTRTMTFAGDIPQGGIARLMRSTTQQLIDSAGTAAARAFDVPAEGEALVISVSCVGRRMVLGERTEEELESVLDAARGRCAQVGFYSYGEISPAQAGGFSELHNQTMTVTVLSER